MGSHGSQSQPDQPTGPSGEIFGSVIEAEVAADPLLSPQIGAVRVLSRNPAHLAFELRLAGDAPRMLLELAAEHDEEVVPSETEALASFQGPRWDLEQHVMLLFAEALSNAHEERVAYPRLLGRVCERLGEQRAQQLLGGRT